MIPDRKGFVLIAILLLICTVSTGQSLKERIEKVGTVYVSRLSDCRLFLELESFQPSPQWSTADAMKSEVGDELQISAVGKTQGTLLHYADIDPEFLKKVNSSITEILSSQLDPTVEFVEDVDIKTGPYFHLEILVNSMEAENEWVTHWDPSYSCDNTFYISLYEYQSGYKKPKKVFGSAKIFGSPPIGIPDGPLTRVVRLDAAKQMEQELYPYTIEKLTDWLSSKVAPKLEKSLSK